eukprot:4647069-Pyramimonas_sp.AAC.2
MGSECATRGQMPLFCQRAREALASRPASVYTCCHWQKSCSSGDPEERSLQCDGMGWGSTSVCPAAGQRTHNSFHGPDPQLVSFRPPSELAGQG